MPLIKTAGNKLIGGNGIFAVKNTDPPGYAKIDGELYKVKTVGNLIRMCEELRSTKFNHIVNKGRYYYKPANIVLNGWRLPLQSEIESLYKTYSIPDLKATTGWPEGYSYSGTGLSGIDLKANGYYQPAYGNVCLDNWSNYTLYKFNNNTFPAMTITTGMNIYGSGVSTDGYYIQIRLVKDA